MKVVKNKVAPPFKIAEFDIMYGKGISKEGNILDIAAEMKIVQKSGAWYSYLGERIDQGRENAKEYLRQNPEIAKEIENKIRTEAAKVNMLAIGTSEEAAGPMAVSYTHLADRYSRRYG